MEESGDIRQDVSGSRGKGWLLGEVVACGGKVMVNKVKGIMMVRIVRKRKGVACISIN